MRPQRGSRVPTMPKPDPRKRFATLRAQFALHGFSLVRSDGSDGPVRLYVERNGAVQPVASIEVAEALLARLTAKRAGGPSSGS